MSFSFRIIGALCVFLCCVTAGFAFSEKLNKRKKFLKDFLTFLNTLETNVRYRGSELVTLIEQSAPDSFAGYFDFNLDDFTVLWSGFVKNIPKSAGLYEDDIRLIKEFGSKAGRADVEGELSNIELYRNLFEQNYNNSLEEYKTKSKLYRTLGILLGAVAAIIII